jgi:hypothetical protein
VTLGEYKLHSTIEPLPPQTFHVVRAVVHPNFKFSPAADRFDVAVLRLDRPVQARPGADPTITSYNASVVKIYNAASSLPSVLEPKRFSCTFNTLWHTTYSAVVVVVNL